MSTQPRFVCDLHMWSSNVFCKCPHCGQGPHATSDPKDTPPQAQLAGGLKFDGDKPRPTLLMQGCPNALAGVIGVLGFGAKKYAADSWKQVENGKTRYRDALYRHLAAVESGEVNDPESGLPHWHHICCNALFLAELNHGA